MSRSEAGKLGSVKSKHVLRELKIARIATYQLFPKQCENCKENLLYNKRYNKFCSRSCAAKINNSIRNNNKNCNICNNECNSLYCDKCELLVKKEKNKGYKSIIYKKQCKFCNNEFIGQNQRKYCSLECSDKIKYEKRLKLLMLGKATNVMARTCLIRQNGSKCMECGWDKINSSTGKCPIELEHIDGNNENNFPSNLKLLCPNCHSLTPTYKALNKGNGRKKRMEKYFEDKKKNLDNSDI